MERAKIDIDNQIDDLCNRLDEHYSDVLEDLRNDSLRIKNALERAYVDHKEADMTLFALRIPWLKGISVDGANTVTFDPTRFDYSEYDGVWDGFFLEGHGAGSGE